MILRYFSICEETNRKNYFYYRYLKILFKYIHFIFLDGLQEILLGRDDFLEAFAAALAEEVIALGRDCNRNIQAKQ